MIQHCLYFDHQSYFCKTLEAYAHKCLQQDSKILKNPIILIYYFYIIEFLGT